MDSDGTLKKRTRLLLFALILISPGFVIAVLAAEIGFRAAGIGSDQFLRSDPVLGVRFIPSKTGLSQGECYRAQPSTNDHGWRDRTRTLAKEDGVFRALVLGDSYMAGLQVEDNETFSADLEKRLNNAGRGRFEVLNFGVPSWGTDQEYLAYREYGRRFEPDLVVVAFYAQNDVSNNYSRLEGTAYPKPFFDIRADELVELPFVDNTPALIDFARRLAAPFRLYPWTRDALLGIPLTHRLLYDLGVVGVVPEAAGTGDSQETPSRSREFWNWPGRWTSQVGVYAPAYPEDWAHAWEITEHLLLRIRDEARRSGAGFLLVALPDPIAVLPSNILRQIESIADSPALDPDRPTDRLRQFAERNALDIVSLVNGFRSRIGDSSNRLSEYYLPCDGHFTGAGHSLVAELVAPRILAYQAAPR